MIAIGILLFLAIAAALYVRAAKDMPPHVASCKGLRPWELFAEVGPVVSLTCGKCNGNFSKRTKFSGNPNIWKMCPHCSAVRRVVIS